MVKRYLRLAENDIDLMQAGNANDAIVAMSTIIDSNSSTMDIIQDGDLNALDILIEGNGHIIDISQVGDEKLNCRCWWRPNVNWWRRYRA